MTQAAVTTAMPFILYRYTMEESSVQGRWQRVRGRTKAVETENSRQVTRQSPLNQTQVALCSRYRKRC
jgi:hypothetical protein